MAQARWRVAVIGCGTAGPAAAILLGRQGHEVTVFERAPQCRPVGAGFLLQPTGMAVLREIGILDGILERAAKVRRLHVVHPSGRTLLDLHYGELRPGLFGAGLHRPVLMEHLIHSLESEGGRIEWGREISSARRVNGKWQLHAGGESVGDGFDLLIIADGARSKLRDLAGTGGVNRGYPWGAHWFIGRNDGAFREDELYQIVKGTRKLCGFLATGHEGGQRLVSLFWSVRVNDDEAWRARPLGEWKREVLDLCPRAQGLLEQIGSWDDILLARYGDVRMRRWHGDGVVVLGDAGHAMSPQLGQGVNLALADASCLARCLAEGGMAAGLRSYQNRRRLNLRYYQLATRWLTPWFQSDHEWLAPMRGVFFSFARHLAPARKFMTRTMAGMVLSGGNEKSPR
jgi:2-polyprenyl-6-methoxyphenol hydroxylase-like FAD-dependent oxidoreductase